jgi:superfamily II DNA or RNA helicase
MFDYQTELASQMSAMIAQGGGGGGLISLPTGGGKTRTALCGLLDAMSSTPEPIRVGWLAPTKELLEQAYAQAASLWLQTGNAPDMTIALRRNARLSPSISFLTPQQVRYQDDVDVVVFDEAHQMAAETFASAANRLLRDDGRGILIGLSATPGRTKPDEMPTLLKVFGRRLITSAILGTNPVRKLQDRGVLAYLRFLKMSNRPSEELTLADRIRISARAAVHSAHKGRKTLIFCESLQASRVTAAVLRSWGVRASYVEGSLPDTERSARLSAFANGGLDVIANQKLLTAGYDLPAVTALVLQRVVRSPIEFEQIVGRAARGPLTGGSSTARILEFENHLQLHGLPQSYYRYQDYGWESGTHKAQTVH